MFDSESVRSRLVDIRSDVSNVIRLVSVPSPDVETMYKNIRLVRLLCESLECDVESELEKYGSLQPGDVVYRVNGDGTPFVVREVFEGSNFVSAVDPDGRVVHFSSDAVTLINPSLRV